MKVSSSLLQFSTAGSSPLSSESSRMESKVHTEYSVCPMNISFSLLECFDPGSLPLSKCCQVSESSKLAVVLHSLMENSHPHSLDIEGRACKPRLLADLLPQAFLARWVCHPPLRNIAIYPTARTCPNLDLAFCRECEGRGASAVARLGTVMTRRCCLCPITD